MQVDIQNELKIMDWKLLFQFLRKVSKKPIHLIDLDGTLIDSENSTIISYKKAFAADNKQVTEEQVKLLVWNNAGWETLVESHSLVKKLKNAFYSKEEVHPLEENIRFVQGLTGTKVLLTSASFDSVVKHKEIIASCGILECFICCPKSCVEFWTKLQSYDVTVFDDSEQVISLAKRFDIKTKRAPII